MKCKKLVPCHDCKGKGYITLALGAGCPLWDRFKTCESCNGLGEVWETMTNADRIRAMNDEELEEFINHFDICDLRTNDECKISYCTCCKVCVMDWLRQPAEEPK